MSNNGKTAIKKGNTNNKANKNTTKKNTSKKNIKTNNLLDNAYYKNAEKLYKSKNYDGAYQEYLKLSKMCIFRIIYLNIFLRHQKK